MTYSEILREAVAHEKAGRWSKASDAWRRAASAYAESNHELRPGDELRHVKRGVIRATCVYIGPREVIYAGTSYTSLTAAAKAAGADLGLARVGSGQLFWGLEKAESPTFLARQWGVDLSEAA